MTGHNNDPKGDDKKNGANTLASIFKKLDALTKEANDRAANTDSILQVISKKVDNFTANVRDIKADIGHIKSEVRKEKRET